MFQAVGQFLGVNELSANQRRSPLGLAAVNSGVHGRAQATPGDSIALSVVQLRETIIRANIDVAINSDPSGRAGALAVDADSV